jgi:REP element-mobilizing transposase RayT
MRLNNAGKMVKEVWEELPVFYAGVDIDSFVVMPNHIHGIIVLVGAFTPLSVGAAPCGRPDSAQQAQGPGQAQGPAPTSSPEGLVRTLSLPDVVHRWKTMTTKRYVDGVRQQGWAPFCRRLWQRNYYEHVIRDDESLNRIRQYILDNPARWSLDRENPQASSQNAEPRRD